MKANFIVRIYMILTAQTLCTLVGVPIIAQNKQFYCHMSHQPAILFFALGFIMHAIGAIFCIKDSNRYRKRPYHYILFVYYTVGRTLLVTYLASLAPHILTIYASMTLTAIISLMLLAILKYQEVEFKYNVSALLPVVFIAILFLSADWKNDDKCTMTLLILSWTCCTTVYTIKFAKTLFEGMPNEYLFAIL